jgi:hypothetical protein
MHDYQRQLEQHALRNVRALVDNLEREERRAIPAGALWTLVAVIIAAAAMALALAMQRPAENAVDKAYRVCLVQALAAHGSELRQRIRREQPSLQRTEVEKLLEGEAAAIRALAEKDCAAPR